MDTVVYVGYYRALTHVKNSTFSLQKNADYIKYLYLSDPTTPASKITDLFEPKYPYPRSTPVNDVRLIRDVYLV